MSELIAKVKSEYKNVLSQGEEIADSFDLNSIEPIEYQSGWKLDDDQWFILHDFSKNDYYIDVCNKDFSTASLIQIKNDEYSRISSICIIQNFERQFQRITPSFYVNRKTVLDYSVDPKIVKQRKQIEIKREPDAVYKIDNDCLYFKSISKIKPIFPEIEKLQREATQEEVNEFIENDFIKLEDGFEAKSVGIYNRKRIADIGKKFNNLSLEKRNKLVKYAKQKSGIDLENNNFLIDSNTNLKKLLYAMDQRYYYADIYDENRIANSIRVVDIS